MYTLSKNVAILALTVAAISSGGAFAMMQDNEVPQITDDSAKVFGHIELVARDANGEIKAYRQTDNLIVTDGESCAANYLFGSGAGNPHAGCGAATPFANIGVGKSATAVSAGQTDVLDQISNKRPDTDGVAASGANGAVIETQWLANTLRNQSGTVAITESGLFNNVNNSTGDMFARQTFSAINVGASDTLTVTWTVTFADSDAS